MHFGAPPSRCWCCLPNKPHLLKPQVPTPTKSRPEKLAELWRLRQQLREALAEVEKRIDALVKDEDG